MQIDVARYQLNSFGNDFIGSHRIARLVQHVLTNINADQLLDIFQAMEKPASAATDV